MSPFEGGNLWLQQYWQFFGMTSEASLGSTVHCKSGRAKGGLWQVQTWCWINHVWTLNYVFVSQQTGLVDWWHTSQVHRVPYLYVLPVVFKLLLSMRLHWFGCLVLIWTSVGRFPISVCFCNFQVLAEYAWTPKAAAFICRVDGCAGLNWFAGKCKCWLTVLALVCHLSSMFSLSLECHVSDTWWIFNLKNKAHLQTLK